MERRKTTRSRSTIEAQISLRVSPPRRWFNLSNSPVSIQAFPVRRKWAFRSLTSHIRCINARLDVSLYETRMDSMVILPLRQIRVQRSVVAESARNHSEFLHFASLI